MNKKDKVFLLTKTPYKESDLVVNLLSALDGKLSAIVYGGKKIGTKSSFTYQPGDLLEVDLVFKENKDFVQLQNIHPLAVQKVESFSYNQFLFHTYFIEIISKITQPGNPAEELFNTLKSNLQLNWKTHELRNICWILWQIVKHGGYAFDFSECAQCQKEIWRSKTPGDVTLRKAIYQLIQNSGHLVCNECKPSENMEIITTAMIKILWIFDQSHDVGEVSKTIPDSYYISLIKFLNQHLLQSFEISPKSLPMFLSSLKEPGSC